MNALELLQMLENRAADYAPLAVESMKRNAHMLGDEAPPTHDQVLMVLTDFINAIGMHNGVDYALYASDLVTS
jgi:hypothetical protein